MAVIEDKTLDDYVHSKIDNDFGLTIDDIAPNVTGYGRFSAWLGDNITQIKEVLQAVKDEGVSPSFFAAYEVSEGYASAFGWLNHTYTQGDYLQDARATAQWIVTQSRKMNDNPAWVDVGTNNLDFVPLDVQQAGNKDFANMPSGTIGRVIIAGTAASTWETYYPKGLLAEYNGIQDYGAPLKGQYESILEWGGTIGDTDGGSDNGGSDGGSDDDSGGTGDSVIDLIKKALTSFTDFLQDSLTWDLHSIGVDKFFSNNYFQMQKTFNNTYRLKMNLPLLDALDDLVNSIDTGGGNDGGDDNGGGDDDNGGGDKKGYDTSDFNDHYFRFRYAKTADDFPPGYPYPSANGHHGNDYDYIYEELKAHVSGTVDGNNGHGITPNDGGIGYADGYGWGGRIVIKLDDGSGRSVMYAHLGRIDVSSGDKIKVGQVIGQTGNTGSMTTGPHLHFELKDASNPDSASDGTIDPTPFIEKYS